MQVFAESMVNLQGSFGVESRSRVQLKTLPKSVFGTALFGDHGLI